MGAYAYAPKPRNFSHSTPLARSCDNVRGGVFFSPCIFVLFGSGKALWGKALGGALTCVRTHTHVCAFFYPRIFWHFQSGKTLRDKGTRRFSGSAVSPGMAKPPRCTHAPRRHTNEKDLFCPGFALEGGRSGILPFRALPQCCRKAKIHLEGLAVQGIFWISPCSP